MVDEENHPSSTDQYVFKDPVGELTTKLGRSQGVQGREQQRGQEAEMTKQLKSSEGEL